MKIEFQTEDGSVFQVSTSDHRTAQEDQELLHTFGEVLGIGPYDPEASFLSHKTEDRFHSLIYGGMKDAPPTLRDLVSAVMEDDDIEDDDTDRALSTWAQEVVAVVKDLEDNRDLVIQKLVDELNAQGVAPSEPMRIHRGEWRSDNPKDMQAPAECGGAFNISGSSVMRRCIKPFGHEGNHVGERMPPVSVNLDPIPAPEFKPPRVQGVEVLGNFWADKVVEPPSYQVQPDSAAVMAGIQVHEAQDEYERDILDRTPEEKSAGKLDVEDHKCVYIGKPSLCGKCGEPELDEDMDDELDEDDL